MTSILVTGGAGFIGANFLNRLVPAHPEHHFVNVDALTYAGNTQSLAGIADAPNYTFVRADVADEAAMKRVFAEHRPDRVFHFAAESHVDRSILSPHDFIRTNVMGTFTLLEVARRDWAERAPESQTGQPGDRVFHHVSTDEVYGSLGAEGLFVESTPYDPSSPYSASKAGSDHLVRAYHRTYGLPVRITNCSNNYGPYQFPEKLIPHMLLSCAEGKPLPVYGDGTNVRDWLFVEDHCDAIWAVAERGEDGETYNIGGDCERANIDVVKAICAAVTKRTGRDLDALLGLITFVKDRPGHDFRYAIDATKIRESLGWRPTLVFEEGLERTINWYLDHMEWVDAVRTGAHREWMERQYGDLGR